MNELDNMPLATELLHMVKQSAKRWFIAFCIMVVLEVATIAGFLWYISLPVEELETIDIENEDGNANYIGNDMNGDFNYGESKGDKTQ